MILERFFENRKLTCWAADHGLNVITSLPRVRAHAATSFSEEWLTVKRSVYMKASNMRKFGVAQRVVMENEILRHAAAYFANDALPK